MRSFENTKILKKKKEGKKRKKKKKKESKVSFKKGIIDPREQSNENRLNRK